MTSSPPWVWLLIVPLALACSLPRPPASTDAASGEPRRATVLATEHDDARAGAEGAQAVAEEMGFLEDEALAAYVRDLGRRLARHAPRGSFSYQFSIVDQFEPNAFALPGGYVYVSRGLLALSNSEDELANVMGHEIGHVAERHAAARQQMSERESPFSMPVVRMARLAAYGRRQEHAADRVGQEIAAQAGFDPSAMASFLKHLRDVERLRLGHSRLPRFLDTHPGMTRRIAACAARARSLDFERPPGAEADRDAYLRRLEGLLLGPNPREGVFRGQRFLHPDLDFHLQFPRGWTVVNHPRAVGARSPQGDALVFLTTEGPARDPKRAAEEFLARRAEAFQIEVLRSSPIQIGRLAGHRIGASGRVNGRAVLGQLTFVPYRGTMVRITAVAPARVAETYLGRARNTARSFGPLTPEERASIEILRVALVPARAGEDLAALGARSGNAWDVARTAVLNGVFANHRFAGGELVKIAVSAPYTIP